MEEAELTIRTICPYCDKMNEAGTIQCKCGFYFNQLYYDKVIKEQGEDALKEFIQDSEEIEAKEEKILKKEGLTSSILFAIGGIIALLLGINVSWYFIIISAFSLFHVLNYFFDFFNKTE